MAVKDLPIEFFRTHTEDIENRIFPRDIYRFPNGLSAYVRVMGREAFVPSQKKATHSVGVDYNASPPNTYFPATAPLKGDLDNWVTEARAMELLCALRDWKPKMSGAEGHVGVIDGVVCKTTGIK